jgi:DNA-binding MarR family transcriptional regulator
MPADTDPLHCAVRLRTALSALTRQLRHALPPEGISVAKLSVLSVLYRLGPMSPSELAGHERVKLQTLTRLLAELEADGWLAREAHPQDRRQSVLSLTKAGIRQLTADVHRREASLAGAIGNTLGVADRTTLLRACALMDTLAASLADTPQPAGEATR